MKKILTKMNFVFYTISLLFMLTTSLRSQVIPKISYDGTEKLKLTELSISVEIVGNFALTTFDMNFYNELNRTLEGEFSFPLGEGQSVSGFAMDMNGKLREAVVVEKELARIAYENTVVRKIDPGLLEKTEGNNYKARIYPILAKGSKHIVLTFEQELATSKAIQTYYLPMGIAEKLEKFELEIKIFGKEKMPLIKDNPFQNFFFQLQDKGYTAKIIKHNYAPNKPLILQMPKILDKGYSLTHKDFFYSFINFENKQRIKAKPNRISILWDASTSLSKRDLSKEFALLDAYFSYLQNVEVQFISFSNTIQKNEVGFVKNGEWQGIKKLIRNIQYDGGTSYKCLESVKFTSDEILFFSDGLSNLGSINWNKKIPVYTINSVFVSNHENLKKIAEQSGGNYINFLRLSQEEALNILKQETFQFLGYNSNSNLEEVFPKKNTNVASDFSLSGRFSKNTKIELLFGFHGEVSKRIELSIEDTYDNEIVKRLWARKKLEFLNIDKKANKKAILSHAKKYHLISDYTSLLILDRLEDYVRYKIEPPAELKEGYKQEMEAMEARDKRDNSRILARKEALKDGYSDLLKWFKKRFPVKKITKVVKHNTNHSNNSHISNTVTDWIGPEGRMISGTVESESDEPLPFTNIVCIENGTNRMLNGTSTDFDGKFSLKVSLDSYLEVSAIGFEKRKISLDSSNNYIIKMKESSVLLEFVVVDFRAPLIDRDNTVSGQTITASDMTNMPARSISSIAASSSGVVSNDGDVIGNRGSRSDATITYIDGIRVVGSSQVPQGSVQEEAVMDTSTQFENEGNSSIIDIENDELVISDSVYSNRLRQNGFSYLKILSKKNSVEEAYNSYLELRNNHLKNPEFYLKVADFFEKKGEKEIAIRVLTNLTEVDLGNYELLRALAYKLEYFEQYDLAVEIYMKVLELRPEDPQSSRDLGLAYQEIGEYQKSFNLLYEIYSGELLKKDIEENYKGIESIVFIELCHLVNNHSDKLNLSKKMRNSFPLFQLDIRVVVDWNHKNTDIDLWVTDPNDEKSYYKHKETAIGGKLSDDMTEGFGPEEFILKKAIDGKYEVSVDYFTDRIQKISEPSVLKVSQFVNYGRKDEKKTIKIFLLNKMDDEIMVGNLEF